MITSEISKSLIVSIGILVFGLMLILATSRLRSKELLVYQFTFYVGLGFFLCLAILMSLLKVVVLVTISYELVIQFALLATILAFGALTLSFLRKERQQLIAYWLVTLVILLLWAIFAFNLNGWSDRIAAYFSDTAQAAGGIGRAAAIPAGLGWILAIGTALTTLIADFRKRRPVQYINRLRYWLLASLLLSGTGLIVFASPAFFIWAGLPLLLAGSILAGYIVLSYHTPDLRLLVARALHYLVVTATLSTLFASGLIVAILISRNLLNPTSVLFWSIILAVFLTIIFPPIWRLLNRFFARIILGKSRHDEKQVIQHYSQRISTALDIKRLGDIIINLMIETLGIEQGIVFVNERKETGNIVLRPLSSIGTNELIPGIFATDSPFIDYFRKDSKILSQYDLEVMPDFRDMPVEERNWLANLSMELYVPIQRQQDLVGLLAFGPQPQGMAYYEEDQSLMIALANQAALAMDSARLFEHLAVINQEVGQLTEQLAGLDQNKSDFLSIASHELRTPLTHIHGYSRMLLDLTEDELRDPSYVKTLIEGIAKGSDRMKDVVDMMFDVSEADIGEMNLFLGPVDLEEVIEQAARPFLTAMDQRRIAFDKKGIKDLPAVEADGTRLVQAFENLISNAIKYTPDGGIITIEGHSIVVDDIGAAVEIVVADSGIGIAPEHQSRIFEKFFRVDDTEHHSTGKTKFKGAGPGLGLTLVKAIAEAHDGRVWVESPGYDEETCPGSTFYFVIPVERTKTIDIEPLPKSQKQSQIETRHWRRKDLKTPQE